MFHLARRFFGFLTARGLTPREQVFVSSHLSADLLRLFYTQRREDQRHAFDVASRAGNGGDVIEAALLHDVGKTSSRLGAVGRTLATVWSATSLPVWGQWRTYLDHGKIGAELLESNGASTLTVSFARYHPGDPPANVEPLHWTALERADSA